VGNGGGKDTSAIFCLASTSPTISNNIIAFNSSGIYKSSGTLTLRANCVFNPAGANYTNVSPGIGDILLDPQLVAVAFGKVHLTASSPCIDAGEDSVVQAGWVDMDVELRIQGAHVDMGADEYNGAPPIAFSPTIVRVSPSGDDANDGSNWGLSKRTVQAGIDAAFGTGGEVWVGVGTYGERITLKASVYVYGGFAGTEDQRDQRNWKTNTTVLDGGAGGSVVTASLVGCRMSCIDGFTIRNGSGAMGNTSTRYGGGIYCPSSPTIANNTIIENCADYGGGVYCFSSSALILNNVIRDNVVSTCGGGVYWYKSVSQTVANTIIRNRSDYAGGGVYCSDSSGLFSGNVFLGNYAKTLGGAMCCSMSSPVIANTAIVGNTAGTNGGGMYSGSGAPTVANCTFNGNLATKGAGLYFDSSNTNMTNCITWGNTGPSVTSSYSNPLFTYCDVQGGWTGTGNVDSDPKFVRGASSGADGLWGTEDDDYGDLRLQAGSPCIDAGSNTAAVAAGILTDLDGHGRFFDDPGTPDCPWAPGTCGTAPIVDMGAYEFIAGDYDRDGDVDKDDLNAFLGCVSGPAIPYAGNCAAADFDRDWDVDQADFGAFQKSFSGGKEGR